MAQADRVGNVNVSKFGTKLAGAGGFINISQNAARVNFLGTFTGSGLEVSIEDGRLKIIKEGSCRKILKKTVEHITFSGKYGALSGRRVLYITERCVFQLTPNGLELIEIAPGIDLHRNIIDVMGFEPIMTTAPKLMDRCIFLDQPMSTEA